MLYYDKNYYAVPDAGHINFRNKRNVQWIKFKRMADEDFIVAGYIKIYSLVLAQHQNGGLVYKGFRDDVCL